MQLKTVWMSPDTQKRSSYLLRSVGGILGIVLLMLVLAVGGMAVVLKLGLSKEIFSLLLTCIATALIAVFALRLGWSLVRDATVFLLTEDNRLFVADLRSRSVIRRNILDIVRNGFETQRNLRRFARAPFLPGNADELLEVEKIRENRGYYAVTCRVRGPEQQVVQRTCYVVKGLAEEGLLVQQLELRRRNTAAPELEVSRMPRYILLSALACAALIALCVCSHPAFGALPQQIYFPCLAAVVVAVFFLLYFTLRYRRGE